VPLTQPPNKKNPPANTHHMLMLRLGVSHELSWRNVGVDLEEKEKTRGVRGEGWRGGSVYEVHLADIHSEPPPPDAHHTYTYPGSLSGTRTQPAAKLPLSRLSVGCLTISPHTALLCLKLMGISCAWALLTSCTPQADLPEGRCRTTLPSKHSSP
jgi:hypothetical protein